MISRIVRESTPVGNHRAKVHTTESSTSDRSGFHPDRCCNVNRARWSVDMTSRGILGEPVSPYLFVVIQRFAK